MPAKSEKQRKAAGAALAIKRGDAPKRAKGAAAQMARSMTMAELAEFAEKNRDKSRTVAHG